jgi:hypothetical protein
MPGEQKGKKHKAGAGRPPLSAAPTVRLTITLPAPQAAQLRDLGGGNASLGVRRYIAALEAEVRLGGATMREIGEVMSDKNIRITRLEAALDGLSRRYVELVNSGDCGHWNPEEEAEVRVARALLKGEG